MSSLPIGFHLTVPYPNPHIQVFANHPSHPRTLVIPTRSGATFSSIFAPAKMLLRAVEESLFDCSRSQSPGARPNTNQSFHFRNVIEQFFVSRTNA
jgi:hypothetical protein